MHGLALFLTLSMLFSGIVDKAAASRLTINGCLNETVCESVRCGTLEVLENREDPAGRRIKLNFVILPAKGPDPAPDPVFCFSGGPGQGAAQNIEDWAAYTEKLRAERDVVLLDQRGTGASNPLFCRGPGPPDSAQTYLKDMYPADYVKHCREELEKKANLLYYHTSVGVDDTEELRQALGYGPINIIGGSFGTYFCLVYMNRYPDSVRSAILVNVAPPELAIPANLAADTQAAFDRLCVDCAADPKCAGDYPDLRGLLERSLSRLRHGPVTQAITNPFLDQPETVTFSLNSFITGLRAMLYTPAQSRLVPLFLHLAADGDYAFIAEFTALYLRWINEDLMDGQALCIYCSENIPYIDFSKARAAAQGTFMGPYRLDQQEGACRFWPRGEIPPDFHKLARLDIPTLLISGEVDAGCPPTNGEYVRRFLPNSVHVIEPYFGHGFQLWGGCLDELALQLVRQGSIDGIDATSLQCVTGNRRPPFASWRNRASRAARR